MTTVSILKKGSFLLVVTLLFSYLFSHLFTRLSLAHARRDSYHFRSIKPTVVSMNELPDSSVLTDTTSSGLQAAVSGALSGTKGRYAVVIKNVKTGEAYTLNEHQKFDSASLYKLWIMGEVFQQIQEGKLTENTQLSQDVEVLNEKFHIASESAEKKEGKIELSVKQALNQMITYSDNYAALILSEKVRISNVTSFLKDNGLLESKVGVSGQNPSTTASDITRLLEKISTGTLVNSSSSKEMLDLLKRQQLNGKIPKYLPAGTVIAHKTGELETVSHDAGIVYTEKGDYLIVVLSDSNSRQQADERIAGISKAVYEYFLTGDH